MFQKSSLIPAVRGPFLTFYHWSTPQDHLCIFKYYISCERSWDLHKWAQEWPWPWKTGACLVWFQLNCLCCEAGNIFGQRWGWCQHTSLNCSLHKGLAENDGTVRNFILPEEAMTGICWVPTLLSLMNIGKGAKHVTSSHSHWVYREEPHPQFLLVNKTGHFLGTCRAKASLSSLR